MTLAFDLDGTLITCEPRQTTLLRAVLAAHRCQTDVARVWDMKRNGATTKQALEACGLSSAAAQAVVRCWQGSIEEPIWLGLDTLQPRAREALEQCRTMGFRLCLVTARSRPEWLSVQLRHLGIFEMFQHLACVSPDRVTAEKADVLNREHCDWFIGDSETDARASQASGVRFLGVECGQRARAFLQKAGVSQIFEGPAQALAWIGTACGLRLYAG